jgi:hypothetical protein
MIRSSYEYGQKMVEIKVNGRRPTYVSVGISVKTLKVFLKGCILVGQEDINTRRWNANGRFTSRTAWNGMEWKLCHRTTRAMYGY